MLLGGFGKVKDYPQISAAGYNFAELDIPEIADLSASEFATLQQQIKNGIPVPIASRLLPAADPLFFTEGFKPQSLSAYLDKACGRTAELGVRAVILGNGKARSMLTEADRQREDIFLETLRLIAETAKKHGQELILEPLSPRYSNYINTVEQAVEIINKAGAANLFTMADLRHMVGAHDPFDSISRYCSFIHHLHIDYPLSFPERLYPAIDDDYNYSGYLNAIKAAGYTGTLTVEADIPQDWNQAHAQISAVLEQCS